MHNSAAFTTYLVQDNKDDNGDDAHRVWCGSVIGMGAWSLTMFGFEAQIHELYSSVEGSI